MGKPKLKTQPIKPRASRQEKPVDTEKWSLIPEAATSSDIPLVIISESVFVGSSEARKHDMPGHVILFNYKTKEMVLDLYIKPTSQLIDANGVDFSRVETILLEDARSQIMEVIGQRRLIGFNTRIQVKKLSLPIPGSQLFSIERTGAYSNEDGTFKSLEELAAELDMECITNEQRCNAICALWANVEKRWKREEHLWWSKIGGRD